MIGKDSDFSRRLLAWYGQHRRDLPWRRRRPDPYHVLVSETMLQQTQVTTVIPYFTRFIARFPTLADLARADPQEVLRQWQGLGYYSRARHLQRAAADIAANFGGKVPSTVERLLELPGIGRYTAGAIASIAFNRRAPILDGNVARVLCRLDAVREDPRGAAVRARLWKRAEEILPRSRLSDFNSAMMELGAMICTPRGPRCGACPVRKHCRAFAADLQNQIPPPKRAVTTPLHRRWVFCIRGKNKFLIEQRPATGRWAGMWQFITLKPTQPAKMSASLGAHISMRTSPPRRIGELRHALSHRRYIFDVLVCEVRGDSTSLDRKWVAFKELLNFPMPTPHVRIAAMVKAMGEETARPRDPSPGAVLQNKNRVARK